MEAKYGLTDAEKYFVKKYRVNMMKRYGECLNELQQLGAFIIII